VARSSFEKCVAPPTAEASGDEWTRPARAGLPRTRAKAQGGSLSKFGLARDNPHSDELLIATQSNGELFVLSDSTRRRHVHIVGQTGSGKTTLLTRMIAQDLATGRGVAVIDPLGHLAEGLLALVPPHRTHEVVYVDAGDLERPVGINVLEQAHPDRHAVIADDVVSAFLHIWGSTAIGDRSQQVLRNSVRALLSVPTGTLLGIPRLLTDETYRDRVIHAIKDPVVASYWLKQFNTYDEKRRTEIIGPILNKLDAALSAPELRNIVGQPRSTIDFRKTMDDGRILIFNLRKGRIGEQNAHILGALAVTKLAQAAFAREDTPQHLRRPFYVFADEFQDYSSAGFVRILSQARNYGLGLTLAHQYLQQLSDELRAAVLGNAATTIALRVGADDSPILAAHIGLEPQVELSGMGEQVTPAETLLAKLPNYQAVGRTLVYEAPTDALHLTLFGEPPAVNKHPERVRAYARARHGSDRAIIEAKITRFLTAT
jgi:GTPase SAR1 family protein